jgi:hypothetical protein
MITINYENFIKKLPGAPDNLNILPAPTTAADDNKQDK